MSVHFCVRRIADWQFDTVMAKETALWDDSALIDAFNAAMNKYRDMHKKPGKDVGNGGSSATANDEHEDEPCRVTETSRSEERDISATSAIDSEFYSSLPGSREAGEPAHSQQDYSAAEISGPKPIGVGHNEFSMQMNPGDSSNVQNMEYSHLVNHYQNLEQQRHEVLQQLYQMNGWNYQDTNGQVSTNAPWTGYGSSQCTQDGSYYPPYLPVQPYCHPHPYCWPPPQLPCMVPCRQCSPTTPWCAQHSSNLQDSCHASTSLKNTVESFKPSCTADGITATIMEGLKKATSTVKAEMSGFAHMYDGEGKIDNSGEESSDTDVTKMLHAWFSAGFYTAKCLSGRTSLEKKD